MAAKRPARARPKPKVTKRPTKRKNPRASDGGTVWVEVLPPTWLERKNEPIKRKKGIKKKKRPSATELLVRFRLGPGRRKK
jgi:hypothetical protein